MRQLILSVGLTLLFAIAVGCSRTPPAPTPSPANEWDLEKVRVDQLASGVEESHWTRLSAGKGTKGPRVYDWTRVAIRPLKEPGKGYWLLVRRSIARPEELACYVCFGPADTTLEDLAPVADTRWAIEECFQEAKDQSLPSRRRGWDWTSMKCGNGRAGTGTSPPCRGTGQALAMLAHAYLAVVRQQANACFGGKKGGELEWDETLIPLTVPEVRRLLYRLIWRPMPLNKSVLAWSRWRRRHQASARLCHYKRRLTLCGCSIGLRGIGTRPE